MKKNDEKTKKRVCLGLLTHPPRSFCPFRACGAKLAKLPNLIISVLTNYSLIVAKISFLLQYDKVEVLKTDFFMCFIKFFFQNICKYPKKNLILQPIIINLLIII